MVKNNFINAESNVKNTKKELVSDIFFGRKQPTEEEYNEMNRLLQEQNNIQNEISKKDIEIDILVNKHRLVLVTDEENESGISPEKIKLEEEMENKIKELKSLRVKYNNIGKEFDDVVKKIERGK